MRSSQFVRLCAFALAVACPPLARGVTAMSAQRASIDTLRRYAAVLDPEAILQLGRLNDADSVPLLRQIASNPNITYANVAHEQKYEPRHPNGSFIQDAPGDHRSACFAARAALTKMKVADYLDTFIVELSTSAPEWRSAIMGDLGYIGDPRAIKSLGPHLFDTEDFGGNGHCVVGISVAGTAAEAIAEIRGNDPYRGFDAYKWRSWWRDHRADYGDHSPLPSLITLYPHWGEIRVATPDGFINLHLVSVPVQFPDLPTKTDNDVLMVLGPKGDLLWWNYQAFPSTDFRDLLQPFVRAHRMYLTPNELVDFTLDDGKITVTRSSSHHRKSPHPLLPPITPEFQQKLSKELSAVTPIVRDRMSKGDSTPVLPTHSIDLENILGKGFFTAGTQGAEPTITFVKYSDFRWTVALAAPNKDGAIVTIGDDYKLLSAAINAKAVFP